MGSHFQARRLDVEVRAGDVNPAYLTQAQKRGRDGVLAQAVAGYIQWMAARYDTLRDGLRQGVEKLRQELEADGLHPRMPTTLAHLALGWQAFLDYVVDTGAADSAERELLKQRAWAGLKSAYGSQASLQRESDPVQHSLGLLCSAVMFGTAHIAAVDGQVPDNPVGLGWRREEFYAGPDSPPAIRWRAQGPCIGWADGEDLYLDPQASFACAQRYATTAGEPLSITSSTLQRRLRDRRLLVTTEPVHLTIRKVINGQRCRVWHVGMSALWPERAVHPVHAVPKAPDVARPPASPDRSSGPVITGGEEKRSTEPVHKVSESPVVAPNGRANGPSGPLLHNRDTSVREERGDISDDLPGKLSGNAHGDHVISRTCGKCGRADFYVVNGWPICTHCHPPGTFGVTA